MTYRKYIFLKNRSYIHEFKVLNLEIVCVNNKIVKNYLKITTSRSQI